MRLLASLALLALCQPAQAQNGQLDPSFGVGGRAWVDFGSDNDMAVVYCRGSNLLAGIAPPDRLAVAKLTANGALDTSFGTGGVRTSQIVIPGATVQIDPVFVAGACSDSSEPIIAVTYGASGFIDQNVQIFKFDINNLFVSVDLVDLDQFQTGLGDEEQVQSMINLGGNTLVLSGRTRLSSGDGRAFVARKVGAAPVVAKVMGATGYDSLVGVWSDGQRLFGIGPYVQASVQNVGLAEITLDANLNFVSNLPGSAPAPGSGFVNEFIGVGRRRFVAGGTQYLMPVQSAVPALLTSTGTGTRSLVAAPDIAPINGLQPRLADGRSAIVTYGNDSGPGARAVMAGLAQFASVPAQNLGHYIAEFRLAPGTETVWQPNPDFGTGGAITIPYATAVPAGCAPSTNFRNVDVAPPFANVVIVGRGNRGSCTNFDAFMMRLTNGSLFLRDGFE
jgi:hypothetical protein